MSLYLLNTSNLLSDRFPSLDFLRYSWVRWACVDSSAPSLVHIAIVDPHVIQRHPPNLYTPPILLTTARAIRRLPQAAARQHGHLRRDPSPRSQRRHLLLTRVPIGDRRPPPRTRRRKRAAEIRDPTSARSGRKHGWERRQRWQQLQEFYRWSPWFNPTGNTLCIGWPRRKLLRSPVASILVGRSLRWKERIRYGWSRRIVLGECLRSLPHYLPPTYALSLLPIPTTPHVRSFFFSAFVSFAS